MTDLELLIDLHVRNDRQGPGGDDETQRAIDIARLDRQRPLHVADIGCGCGASSLVLATSLNAHVTAVDAAPPFIERVGRRAAAAGVADRIDSIVGDMTVLPFEEGQLDAIWSEGAIYNMGFEAGLRSWQKHLRPGGIIAVSELTWTTAQRPPDVEDHWTREYPAITTASSNMRTIEDLGYEPLGMFFLDRHCWETNYYAPLAAQFPGFIERHAESDTAMQIVAEHETEIDLYRRHGGWFSYGFFIARRT
ncbi:MAG: class I SAM-dependent methyltransferase [Planctomycetota bacterium]